MSLIYFILFLITATTTRGRIIFDLGGPDGSPVGHTAAPARNGIAEDTHILGPAPLSAAPLKLLFIRIETQ